MEQQQIAAYLLKNGIRPLQKRVKIMSYLVSKRNHPTVDMIYNDLIHEISGLSKTTIYNVLNLFVESGVALALNIEGNEIRYDADTSVHGHFKCKVCSGVIDFRIKPEDLPNPGLQGFRIDEEHYYLKGVCAFCISKIEA
ncbi:MAG: transcriptional repressor [Marinilabiliales bacterium]|nr:transcriptional repressor [Marinilabiliales bacterium]